MYVSYMSQCPILSLSETQRAFSMQFSASAMNAMGMEASREKDHTTFLPEEHFQSRKWFLEHDTFC